MRKLTDEQLDLVLQKVLQDSALDNQTLDEIADSPNILWNVKREIKQEKAKAKKGWIWDINILIPSFAALGLLFVFGMFWLLSSPNENVQIAVKQANESLSIASKPIESPEVTASQPSTIEKFPTSNSSNTVKSSRNLVKKTETKKVSTKFVETKVVEKVAATPKIPKIKSVQPNGVKVQNNETKVQEYKTDFIALSYLPTPESGQIVRVKVPRAMMVSLGVTNNVSKNNEMVNAEVIVGDDGTSRAIRFISTNNK